MAAFAIVAAEASASNSIRPRESVAVGVLSVVNPGAVALLLQQYLTWTFSLG